MIEDQIALALKAVKQRKKELNDIKKDLKIDETIDSEEYLDLKKALKDLKTQTKEVEDRWKQDLLGDEQYVKLREMKVEKEEEVAEASEKLFELISKLPPKPFLMSLETEEGPVKIQIQPEMRLYMNGKEEKKRS